MEIMAKEGVVGINTNVMVLLLKLRPPIPDCCRICDRIGHYPRLLPVSYSDYQGKDKVSVGNGQGLQISNAGVFVINTPSSILLSNILRVPDIIYSQKRTTGFSSLIHLVLKYRIEYRGVLFSTDRVGMGCIPF